MNFRSKNLLVTGGAGFIGSNFIDFILKKYKNVRIFNLDSLTYAGALNKTEKFSSNSNYKFFKGDICNQTLLNTIFKEFQIDGVINFAAETHVDNSITNPMPFIKSNINGVFSLLNVCYNNWMKSPFKYNENFLQARFHQISTDEVYGSISEGSFCENSLYSPNSPYSASKASADMIVRSFNKTYGLNVTTSISSNNYGPNQHKEKLIPKIINSIKNDDYINIYGDGRNIRDWIHVYDNCNAICSIFNESESGGKFNVASGQEITNLELILKFKKIYSDKPKIRFISDRFGHDFRYSIDTSLIKNKLGFKTNFDIENYIKELNI